MTHQKINQRHNDRLPGATFRAGFCGCKTGFSSYDGKPFMHWVAPSEEDTADDVPGRRISQNFALKRGNASILNGGASGCGVFHRPDHGLAVANIHNGFRML